MGRRQTTDALDMSRQVQAFFSGLMLATVLLTGCHPTQPFYFCEDGDLSHYKGVATEIEYPDVDVAGLAEVEGALPPLTLANSEAHEIWDLALEEAVRYTLANAKVVRVLGPSVDIPDTLLSNPDFVETVYGPAVTEANPRTGVEAALSAFDTQFTTNVLWERNERPINFLLGGLVARELRQDLGTFQSQLQKTSATGGTFAIRNNTTYEYNNNPTNLFASAWNTNVEMEFRQPLLQGAGVQFNRIAGPNNSPGFFFSNGVVLARIDTDISLADFEASVRNLVSDVERAYWELYNSYRSLDALIAGRDSALQTWRRVYALYQSGAEGGRAEEEAQAREQYFLFRANVEEGLSQLYLAESRLRYVMGLAATDGRLIRPSDEPTTAKVAFDWHEIQLEALARSVELRRQKWQVKRREMELIASRNFLLPRLDAVGRYRWLGFGDHLIDPDGDNPPFDNAFETMTSGDFQDWQLGVQLSLPLGFRRELAGVRSAQLQLARDRAILQDQELELSHQLSNAIRNLDRHYTLSQTQFNRRAAAQRQVEAVKAAYEVGQVTLDLLLDAQRRLADAEIQFYSSLVEYSLAITQVHFRKGSLLEYNNVQLAEAPWPGKAYFDARKRARARDAAHFLNYGYTRPRVLSRGPIMQHQYRSTGTPVFDQPSGMVQPRPEAVPTPAPVEPQPLSTEPLGPQARSNMIPPGTVAPSSAAISTRQAETFDWGQLGLNPSVAPVQSTVTPVSHQQVAPRGTSGGWAASKEPLR